MIYLIVLYFVGAVATFVWGAARVRPYDTGEVVFAAFAWPVFVPFLAVSVVATVLHEAIYDWWNKK